MKQIIINADDFGANEIVTKAIKRNILDGNISSTTVMANGSSLEEVRNFALEHPEVSYGIHLCLSEFESVTKSQTLHLAGLTDENGEFIHKAVYRLKNFDREDVKKAIKEELNAQIDVVSSLGFKVSHADSHHHVHTIYPLRDIFAEVLNNRGITKIRQVQDFRTWRSKRHLLQWYHQIQLKKYYSSNFRTTDTFYSYWEYIRTGGQRGENVIELMCHPGHPGQSYKNEMKLVETKAALNQENIKMISYNEIY